MGNFITQLDNKKTPITTANFIKLVNEKFFDSIIFHRVVKNFVIQGGDPTGTGNGGCGYTIDDEYDSLSNVQKTIGMANDGAPHTAGSQFYFNLVNNVFLDHKYTVFGKVVSNFVVVQNIGKVAVNGADRPLIDVVMDSVRVTPFVGIKEIEPMISNFKISPNPISELSKASFYSDWEQEVEISVVNQLGVNVYSQSKKLQRGRNSVFINELIDLKSNGIYYLMINDGSNIFQQKLVINR